MEDACLFAGAAAADPEAAVSFTMKEGFDANEGRRAAAGVTWTEYSSNHA